MGQKGPKAMPTPSLFKMKYQGKGGAEALLKSLTPGQENMIQSMKKSGKTAQANAIEKGIKDAPKSYGSKDKALKAYGSKNKALMLDDPDDEVVVEAQGYDTLESKIKQAANKYKNKQLAGTSDAIYEAAKGNINISSMSKNERDYIQQELSGAAKAGDNPESSLQTFRRMQKARQDRALGK